MRYLLLHKANGILLGMCVFIFETPHVFAPRVMAETRISGPLPRLHDKIKELFHVFASRPRVISHSTGLPLEPDDLDGLCLSFRQSTKKWSLAMAKGPSIASSPTASLNRPTVNPSGVRRAGADLAD
jgi:hypothetical protein